MAGNFMSRVVSYVVNEFAVNALANSRSFQRFAVRTSNMLESVQKATARKKVEIKEQLKDISEAFEKVQKQ